MIRRQKMDQHIESSTQHSMILLALVDHQYHFRYINVGTPGRSHDAFVYGRSQLHKLVESDSFKNPIGHRGN
ncbi:hypothetical protein HPB50_010471 [Hyalomma asiaticum]|uniref:Uncharacterized protein n=1 Tax=Hyalomma asiaticum TaxID=266040 RepID=A0ACB7SWY3_HYAAI|nr:hypothetical protein HPB50_010471 [Hyalomma asiaticum]